MKRLLSILLCSVMALSMAACGTNDESNSSTSQNSLTGSTTTMGRWVESEALADQDLKFVSAPVCLEDGALWLFALDTTDTGIHKYVSNDNGETWTEEVLEWNDQTQGIIPMVSVSPDGTVFFQSIADTMTSWVQNPGNDLKQVDLSGINASDYYLLDSTTLLLTENVRDDSNMIIDNKNYIYDMTSEQVITSIDDLSRQLQNTAVGKDSTGNSLLYFMDSSGGDRALTTLNKNGSVTAVYNSVPNVGEGAGAAMDIDGNYYYGSEYGIFRIANGGTISENILDGTGLAISLSNYFCKGLCRTQNGDFITLLVSTEDLSSTKLYRYHWDENLTAANNDALEVWSLEDNSTVRAAIVEYGKASPDVTIKYTVATADSTVGTDSILQTLNAEILAGGGPDVLILDSIDYESYIKQGLLVNLAEAVDTSTLVQNIVTPFINDGSVYILPARFSVPIIYGETGTVEALSTLYALKDAILACKARPDANMNDDAYYTSCTKDDQYGMAFLSVEQLLHFALQSSASALIQDNKIDTDAVREVLGFVQAVGNHYGMANYRADQQFNHISMSGEDGTDTVTIGDGGYEYSVTQHARYGWDVMATPALLNSIGRSDNSEGSIAAVQPGLVENAYLPSTLVGVNSNSAIKDNALTFVQVLFSENVQNTFQQDGTPVLQSALDNSIKKSQSGEKKYGGDINELYKRLKSPVFFEITVEEKMLAHAAALVEGKQTLDEAVAGVENDLSLYLAEKE